MLALLRQLIRSLSDLVSNWERFQNTDIAYFFDEDTENSSANTMCYQASLEATEKCFLDLKDLLRKLKSLEEELSSDNPQGVSRRLG